MITARRNVIWAILVLAFLNLPLFPIRTASATTDSETPESEPRSNEKEYKLLPGDGLRIAIYDDEELSDGVERTIGEDGTVTIPYVNVIVKVKGLTLQECKDEIMRRLREEEMYHDPNLDVAIAEFGKRSVVVTGYVERPGEVAFEEGKAMTIEEAIARAGGFSKESRPARNRVKLTRANKSGRLDTIEVRVEDIMNGKADPVYLQPGDIIEVDDKFL